MGAKEGVGSHGVDVIGRRERPWVQIPVFAINHFSSLGESLEMP